MLCTFVPDKPGYQVCTECKRPPVRVRYGGKLHAVCRPRGIPRPDPAKQLCVHLGEQTGERDCETCKGRQTRLKTFHCQAGFGDVTLRDCRRCASYKPFGPTRITRVSLPDYCFNAGLAEVYGKLKLCWRQKPRGSDIWIGDLAEDGWVENAVKLFLPHPLCHAGREDPRLFWYRDRLHVGFCGVQSGGGRIVAHQLLSRFNETVDGLEETWYPRYEDRATWEKNWSWFDHDGELYCVYSISPHVVLADSRCYRNVIDKCAETPWQPRWSGGLLRGGAPPVRVGDEYWSFFHGTLDQPGMPRRVYSTGVYCFEAKPPFRPTRYTPEPLQWPDEATRPAGLGVSVVFVCGAVRRGDTWLVSYGVHDRWTEIAEFSHAGIERAMTWT